jgi:putative sigma-54 modulation protein
MQVNVTFRHLEPSDALKSFAREKVERVKKYLDQASEANVVLSLEKHVHHAEVLVHSGPFFLRGREQSDDMYASIGMAMDKIEKQIKRYKDRLRTHKTSGHHNAAAFKVKQEILEAEAPAADEAPAVQTDLSRVVQTNELMAKRMTVDEAVLQMNMLEEPFIVFTNAATSHVAILHRLPGKTSYSLIDARPAQ